MILNVFQLNEFKKNYQSNFENIYRITIRFAQIRLLKRNLLIQSVKVVRFKFFETNLLEFFKIF